MINFFIKSNMRKVFFFPSVMFLSLLIFCFESCDNEAGSEIKSDTLNPTETYTLTITEPSGIAYNYNDSILYVVSDNSPYVYRISTSGQTLPGSINVNGSDMEGISFARGSYTFYIIEERLRKVLHFDMGGNILNSFFVNVTGPANNGLEGVAVNIYTGNIYIANQKDPILLLEFNTSGQEISRTSINYVPEISDLCFDSVYNCLWMVSSSGKTLNKITTTGNLIKSWIIPVSTAEGITIKGNNLYIVCDSEHKLYVFTKP